MTDDDVNTLIAAFNRAQDEAERLRTPTGVWFHTSPQSLAVGTLLVPRGGPSPDPQFYAQGFQEDTGTLMDMGAPRPDFVWLSNEEAEARFWAKTLKTRYIYEVQPTDAPRPWNGTGADGWVTTAAVILRLID